MVRGKKKRRVGGKSGANVCQIRETFGMNYQGLFLRVRLRAVLGWIFYSGTSNYASSTRTVLLMDSLNWNIVSRPFQVGDLSFKVKTFVFVKKNISLLLQLYVFLYVRQKIGR